MIHGLSSVKWVSIIHTQDTPPLFQRHPQDLVISPPAFLNVRFNGGHAVL